MAAHRLNAIKITKCVEIREYVELYVFVRKPPSVYRYAYASKTIATFAKEKKEKCKNIKICGLLIFTSPLCRITCNNPDFIRIIIVGECVQSENKVKNTSSSVSTHHSVVVQSLRWYLRLHEAEFPFLFYFPSTGILYLISSIVLIISRTPVVIESSGQFYCVFNQTRFFFSLSFIF